MHNSLCTDHSVSLFLASSWLQVLTAPSLRSLNSMIFASRSTSFAHLFGGTSLCSRHIIQNLRSVRMASKVTNTPDQEQYDFGPWKISSSEVFAVTPFSYAFVNLKPVVPGHVLVSPKRVVKRYAELSPEEVADIWCLAQRVGSVAESHFKGQSLTLAIQDGPLAGQTVPHVHIHILPRKAGDFEKNDEVYDAIDENAKALPQQGDHLDLDKARAVRTREEMAAEAAQLRPYFRS